MPVSPKHLSRLVSKLGVNSRWLTHHSSQELEDPLIYEITLDIEEVTTGTLFIARQLWYVDTHQYLAEAIKKGAAALIVSCEEIDTAVWHTLHNQSALPILWVEREDPTLGIICDRFYEHPSAELKVYGVTGTNGKTSAVTYLAELLSAVGERVAIIGTVEYRFEDRRLVAPNTTPDALIIQRFLREAIELGATALALEVSSHALSLDRVAGLRFDAVGFTSFGRDHLDFHGSLEAYREAKGRLFSEYLEFALHEGKSPIAVAHADADGLSMLSRTPSGVRCIRCDVHSDVVTFNEETDESIQHQVSRDADEMIHRFDLLELRLEGAPSLHGLDLSGSMIGFFSTTYPKELPKVSAPLIGDYHPLNVAIAFGMVLGTHPDRAIDAWQSLSSSSGVSGRMERVIPPHQASDDERVALVDYAHTPDAIARALKAIRAVHRGEVSVVIGCGGDRDRGKRPDMLRAALDGADQVWLTSDNPRGEDPFQIIDDALAVDRSLSEKQRCHVVVDRRQCISDAWRKLSVRGALLITGKGHEPYQEVMGRRYRLRDQEALVAAHCAERAGHLQLDEIPLCESVFELRSLSCQENSDRSAFVLLIREASLRVGGLIIGLNIEEEQLKGLSVLHCKLTISDESVEGDWIDQLWSAAQALTPRHRILLLSINDLGRANQLIHLLSDLIAEARSVFPRPQLRLVQGQEAEEDHRWREPGGWSSADTGPKIPSLMERA